MNIIKTYIDAKKESLVIGTYQTSTTGLGSGKYIIGQKRIGAGTSFKEIRVE